MSILILPPSHKRWHTFLFSLSHKRCNISLFGKSSLSNEYKNYIFSLHLTHKTKPPKIPCRLTSVTSFRRRREYLLWYILNFYIEYTHNGAPIKNIFYTLHCCYLCVMRVEFSQHSAALIRYNRYPHPFIAYTSSQIL